MRKFIEFYERIFSIVEIRASKRLHWVYFVLIAGFTYNFYELRKEPVGILSALHDRTYSCPEYFRTCQNYFFLDTVPNSYSYDLFFAGVYAILMTCVFLAVRKHWTLAHALLWPLVACEIYFSLLMTGSPSFPLVAFNLFPCLIFLLCRSKLPSMRILLVILYVFAGLVKLHEGWIAGTYFSTLKLGLPLTPRFAIPLMTNLVMVMELFGTWFLLSEKPKLRYPVLAFFVIFHFFSFVFVGFRYPTLCLPMLMVLYAGGIQYEYESRLKPSYLAMAFMLTLICFNLRHFAVEGDSKLTFEGVSLAFTMIDGNRQVISTEKTVFKNGVEKAKNVSTSNAYDRIRPYTHWYRMQMACQDPSIDRIEWKMDVSLNGAPYRRIIEESNVCKLDYNSFGHNAWIHADGKIVGYPEQNVYVGGKHNRGRLQPAMMDHPVIELTPLQNWLEDHVGAMCWFYAIGCGSIGSITLFSKFILWRRRNSDDRETAAVSTQDDSQKRAA